MPINAGAIGVPPVAPQRPTGETEGIQRRGVTTADGFRPQTTVALKTAIEDLAGTLSKISSQEKFGLEKLPADIGQVVKNILQQSFSINATLSQGIGSTIESQRFSNDQLMILARMLAQIGALADKGFSMELSDETKTLLTQFKNLLVTESGGNILEPVLMSKSAFELIDHKNPEQLPQALYEILSQLAQPATVSVNQPQQSEGMQFLNQLVKFFMPRPTSTESATQQQTQNQTQQQTQQRPTPTPTQRLLNSMYRQLEDPYANLPKQQAAAQNQAAQQNLQPENPAQNQQTQTQNQQTNSQSQNLNQQANSQPQNLNPQPNSQPQNLNQPQNSQPQNLNQQQNSQPQNLNQQQNSQPQNLNQQQNSQPQNLNQQQNSQPQNLNQQQNSQPQNLNQQQNSQPQNLNQSQQNSQPQASFFRGEVPQLDQNFVSKQQELKNQMQDAKNLLLKQPLQNNEQTMNTMKNLAQVLLKNNAEQMTAKETLLLQNFVNNTQKMLPEAEARHLQNLLRLCQQNVPSVVQQAAVQHKLPDLPRLWAFMQLCDMANLSTKMTPRAFKKAGREVSDFANIMRNFSSSDNTTVQNQRSFQMMVPIYLGESSTSYPTYLSIYDENTKDPDTGAEKKETWLRICVLTDNIGAAELIFRVYEGNQLDMRFYFSEADAADDFRDYVSNLRGAIRQTHFQIGEIRIGSIGERMLAS